MESLKVLGQADLAATTLTDVYTVPSSKMAVLSSIVVCNRNGSASSYRVAVAPDGVSSDPKHFLVYDAPIDANTSHAMTWGISLSEGDIVRAYSADPNVSVNIFGTEVA
jgi:hypothetical protein